MHGNNSFKGWNIVYTADQHQSVAQSLIHLTIYILDPLLLDFGLPITFIGLSKSCYVCTKILKSKRSIFAIHMNMLAFW